jgi:hypothetical protein
MKKLILIFTLVAGSASAANYSNYASVMAPAPRKHYTTQHGNQRAARLDKVSQVLGLLSVVSLTAVYYTNRENPSLAPYALPVGLCLGSFIISAAK